MKYITFAIPSYNSEKYLHKAVDSLLPLQDDCEIIIVNDGSKDNTLKIALEYQAKYPNIVKVIDKPNGGHGSGVNAGIKNATGLYYKVVDSDDWLDEKNIFVLLETIKNHYAAKTLPDLYIMDFIYEHVEDNTTFVRTYKKHFPHYEITDWNGIRKKFRYSQFLMMHSVIHKTEILKEAKVELPEHTFYVDNLYIYQTLPLAKTIYYLPLVLYHYFIGRADQSVQIKNVIARYEQQIRVMRLMLEAYSYEDIEKMPKKLKQYMKHFVTIIMLITQMFTTGELSQARKDALKSLWTDLAKNDKKLYNYLKYLSYNSLLNIFTFRMKGKILKFGYYYLAKKEKLG